jgi:hypothetical protein
MDLNPPPLPLVKLANRTLGEYDPGSRLCARVFIASVTVTPVMSVAPVLGFAVIHGGAPIEYLTVPVVALTRY